MVIVVVVLLGEKAGQFGLPPEKCGTAAEFCQRCFLRVFIVRYMERHRKINLYCCCCISLGWYGW